MNSAWALAERNGCNDFVLRRIDDAEITGFLVGNIYTVSTLRRLRGGGVFLWWLRVFHRKQTATMLLK